jgi:hypothetical protein
MGMGILLRSRRVATPANSVAAAAAAATTGQCRPCSLGLGRLGMGNNDGYVQGRVLLVEEKGREDGEVGKGKGKDEERVGGE